MNRSGVGVKLLAVSIVAVLAMTAYYAVEGADDNDVIILFTNDVHCGYKENIGYDGLAAYKQDMEKEYNHVLLVDSGDYLQGGTIGSISSGLLPLEYMMAVGYDIVTVGNHDFDYGARNLWSLLENSGFDTVCCNVTYTGHQDDPTDFVQPYTIKQCGGLRIAFIGVTTPTVVNTTLTSNLEEDDEIVYDFCSGDGTQLYASVQNSIDACKAEGATQIVLLSHLGDSESPPYTSVEVAKNTTGLTCILDGHQHSTIDNLSVKDKNGHDVSIASTGTKINNIGCLKITQDGNVSIKLVNSESYTKKDPVIKGYIDLIDKKVVEWLGEPLYYTPVDILDHDGDGVRTVRNQETAIGNLIADAYRIGTDSDIALFGGGGIRDSIHKGDISLNDLLAVLPFRNMTAVVEVTGQTILYDLEMSCRLMTRETKEGTAALGEFGGFQSVSGIKFDVDTGIESPVIVDENENFVGLKEGQQCRVKNVMVLDKDTQKYVPLDVNKKYTVSGIQFLLLNGGDGFTMFKDAKVLVSEGPDDILILTDYLATLSKEGILDMYSAPQGRINRV